jgi:hypothetical protein
MHRAAPFPTLELSDVFMFLVNLRQRASGDRVDKEPDASQPDHVRLYCTKSKIDAETLSVNRKPHVAAVIT